jgi:hypothetical protein
MESDKQVLQHQKFLTSAHPDRCDEERISMPTAERTHMARGRGVTRAQAGAPPSSSVVNWELTWTVIQDEGQQI